jgi:hypothetical protein
MHKRVLFITPAYYSTKPHEIAESEEKDSHNWGQVTEKDTSFKDVETSK